MLLGYDVDAGGPRARALADYLAAREEAVAAGRGRRRRRDRAARPVRRPRRAEPQPAGRRGGPHREPRAQPARALPHLPAEPRRRAARPARAVPRPAGRGAGALRRHRPRPHAGAGGGGLPDLPGPAALGARGRAGDLRCCSAGSPSRRRPASCAPRRGPPSCSTGWSGRPSCGSRSSATWPAASGSAGSTSRPWTRSVQTSLRECATSSSPWRRTAVWPTGRTGSTRWPRSPSRSSASWPSGWSAAYRPMSRCWRSWRGGTTASTTCTTCASLEVAGRPPFVVADYASTTARPTWCRRSARSPSCADRPGRGWRRRSATRSRPPDGEGHEAVVDLYLSWPDAPEVADEAEAAGAGPLVAARCRSPTTYAGSRSPSARRRRPVDYFTFRPGGRRRRASMAEDDLVRGMHPMVGRRLSLWRLRDFDVTRLEAPEDVLLYECVGAGQPRRPSGSSRWPRCASSPSSATPRVRSLRSPTRSVPSRTASRRSGGRAPSAAPPGPPST